MPARPGGYRVKLRDLPVGATFRIGGYPGRLRACVNGTAYVALGHHDGSGARRHRWDSEIVVVADDPPVQRGPAPLMWWIQKQSRDLNLWVSSHGGHLVLDADDYAPTPNLYGWGAP